MTDLERLQAKANAVTDDSLDATKRMMAMMEEVSMKKMIKLMSLIMLESSNWSRNSGRT